MRVGLDICEGSLIEEKINLVFGSPEWNQDQQKPTLLKKLVTARAQHAGQQQMPSRASSASHNSGEVFQNQIPSVPPGTL